MKYFILTALMIVAGCDTPTRSRFPTTIGSGNTQTAPGFDFTSGGTSPGTTPGTQTPSTDPGFETCTLTKNHQTADLGNLGICQNTQNEAKIRFVSSLGDSTRRTCLIPTYKDQSGNSMYLGEAQCTYTEAEKVYTGTVIKNRPGVGSYPITGVMVMKENLLPEYFECMNFIQKYCPNAPTYAPCVQARNNYCQNFKMKYPNNYLDLYI